MAGEWKNDFDPYQIDNGFIEANAVQNTWFVPHDLEGLSNLMGGREIAAARLNGLFEEAQKLGFTAGTSHERETHPQYSRIPINYGNQPSIQTAFIFNHFDKPWLTQYWLRRVIQLAFDGLTPACGYNGDEDQGLMGSLSVLMKMGLFSMDGGCSSDPQLEMGSPLFDKITIHLNPHYFTGKEFVIEARNNSAQNIYIQSASWNGNTLDRWSISQAAAVKGGTLVLQMGAKPNEQWAVRKQ